MVNFCSSDRRAPVLVASYRVPARLGCFYYMHNPVLSLRDRRRCGVDSWRDGDNLLSERVRTCKLYMGWGELLYKHTLRIWR
jgi:hypothetical protein